MKVNLSLIERFIMAPVYIFCGLYLLLGDNIFGFADFQRYGLGAVLLIYGVIRGYQLIKKIIEEKDEKEII